jgi:hypothetical protein
LEYQIYQKFLKKTVFRTLKVERSQKYGSYPTEFLGWTQISKKIIGKSNQPIRGAKNVYGSYPTEFVGWTQNPKKNIGTSNQPISTNIFSKKCV